MIHPARPPARRRLTVTIDGTLYWLDQVQLHAAPVTFAISPHAVQPDPGWSHVDGHGHLHRWCCTDRHHPDVDCLPTLIDTSEHRPCDGSCAGVCGGEGYRVTVWRCRTCGDQVAPGYQPDHKARTTGVPVVIGPATADVVVKGEVNGRGPLPAVLDIDGHTSPAQAWPGTVTRRRGPEADQPVTFTDVTLVLPDPQPRG